MDQASRAPRRPLLARPLVKFGLLAWITAVMLVYVLNGPYLKVHPGSGVEGWLYGQKARLLKVFSPPTTFGPPGTSD